MIAFALGAFLIFGGLGHLPLMQPDEGRNAEVAREMKESGNWLVPTYNGLPYLDKPAFYFKTVALSFSLLGETETAARLSSALSGFLLLVLTFLFARREYGTRTGALAVMVIATSPLFLAFSRLVIFDMMLALFVCGAIFAGYIAEQKQSRGWYALGAASAAIGTLIKGPVGFLVPGLVLGVYHALDRRWGALRRFFAPLNLLVFFGLTLPWFFGVNHHYHDFAYYGLVEESFRRYTTTAFRRTGPFYYYVPWIVIGMFTWCLLLPESIVAAWRSRRQWTSTDRLLMVWTVVVLVFFSVSQSKRPDYILSAIVALGVLIARVLARTHDGVAARLVRRGTAVLAIVCIVGAGCLLVAALHPSTFGALIKMRSERPEDVTDALTRLAVALLAGGIAAVVAWWRREARAAVAVFVGVPVIFIAAGFSGIRLYAASKSARALADQIPPLPPNTEIACLRCFPTGLPFYRKQIVNVISNNGDELTSNYIIFMLKKTKPWPAGVVPLDERDHWLAAQRQPVFLLARRKARDDLESIAAARGATMTNLVAGWWGALLPAPGGP